MSPDAAVLAVATGRNTVPVIDTATWRERLVVRQTGWAQPVYAAAFAETTHW